MIESQPAVEIKGLLNVILTFLGGSLAGIISAIGIVRKSRVDERQLYLTQSELLFNRYKALHDDCEGRYDALHERLELLEAGGLPRPLPPVA